MNKGIHYICRLDKEIYSCISKCIVTDEVIITDVQIEHILERHNYSFESISNYIKMAVKEPDFIIEDKCKYTGLVIKRILSGENIVQVVLRICTPEDEKGYKNSIISCWEISERRLANYLRNKNVLYKRE